MSVTIRNIIPRKSAESVLTAQYTAANCKTLIDKFTATNTSAAIATLSVYLVASGGAANTFNQVLVTKSIQPGECYLCPEIVGQSLEPGGFIATFASASSAITISCTAREIT